MAINISIDTFIEDFGEEGVEAIKDNLNARWYFDVGYGSLYRVTAPYKDACDRARKFYRCDRKTEYGCIHLTKVEMLTDNSQQPEGV